MKRVFVTLVVVAVIGGAVWYFFQRDLSTAGAVAYRTVDIRRGDLENTISSSGTLSAVSTVNVGSQVSGTLVSVHADFNDEVQKGQILAELDTTMLEATVVDARATLMRAKAQLAQARAEMERNRALYEKGYLSESEFLTFTTDVDVKAATVAGADAGLKKSMTNLSYAVITSPIDGIVIHRSVDPGQTIAASFQTPELFVIAEDLGRMQIEVAVDESDIGQVREGMPVRFEVQTYPDEVFHGNVRQVRLQPQTISNVVNYTVIVDAANPDGRLLPGMTATVDFIVDNVTDAWLAPNAAVTFRPNKDLLDNIQDGMKDSGSAAPGLGSGQRRDAMNPDNTGGITRRDDGVGGDARAARIYLLDEANNISILAFKPGVSDGIVTEMTEIIRGPRNPEGLRAITGVATNTSANSSRSGFAMPGSPMGGPPPGARGMRRSGI